MKRSAVTGGMNSPLTTSLPVAMAPSTPRPPFVKNVLDRRTIGAKYGCTCRIRIRAIDADRPGNALRYAGPLRKADQVLAKQRADDVSDAVRLVAVVLGDLICGCGCHVLPPRRCRPCAREAGARGNRRLRCSSPSQSPPRSTES